MFRDTEGLPPGIEIVGKTEGPVVTKLGQPLERIQPVEDFSHIERHWGGEEELGSRFNPNTHFEDAQGCARFCEEIANILVDPEELDRSHTITVEFDEIVGYSGIVEIEPDEQAAEIVRDEGGPGEAKIKAVPRIQKPHTNLLTFEVKPVFPPKGSKGEAVKFQLSTAFPGLPAPRLITKRRIENHRLHPERDPIFENDQQYWKTHAFIIKTDIPGVWMREHGLKLPKASEVLALKSKVIPPSSYPRLLVVDPDGNVVASVSYGYYELHEDVGPQYNEDKIEADIERRMSEILGLREYSCHVELIDLTNEQYRETGLDKLDVAELEVLTGKPDHEYEVDFEEDY